MKASVSVRMRTISVLILACAPAALAAQQESPLPTLRAAAATPGQIPVDHIVAVVGKQPILWSDVLTYVNQQRAAGLTLPPDSAGQAVVAREALTHLIDEEILVQKARDLKIEITESEVNRSVDDQIRRVRSQFGTEDEYRAELRQAGFGTPDEYRRSLYQQFYRRALQQRAFADLQKLARPKNVSEEEVTEAFERNRAVLSQQPASITFRQLVIAPKPSAEARARARARIDSLLVEVRAGGDFEQIARRESMDPGTRQTGGDLGWNRRGATVPEFERALFSLRPGQLSSVVETQFGYHIMRIDRVQAGEVKARHILIAPEIGAEDIAAARAQADSAAAQWRRGVPFDTLVARYHDPAEEKGILQPFPRDSLPPAYRLGIGTRRAGEITEPFELSGGRGGVKFGVLQIVSINEMGEFVEAEVRERIRQQLAAEQATRELLDDMRKQTYVSIRL